MNNSLSSWKRIATAMAISFLALAVRAQTALPIGLPLYFEANQDKTEFRSSGSGYQFLISPSGVQITLRESSRVAMARMEFDGANKLARIGGQEELSGKVNYLVGNDPSQWETGLPTFGKVQVTEIYPGINLVFHGNQRQLEYDFAIAPGANANVIKMRFDGVDRISISPQGDLVIKIGGNEIHQPAPEVYQMIGGVRKVIRGGYKILDARTVGFETDAYNHSLPLVIDPVLGYSSFFGGNVSDVAWAIALDTNDDIYIAGSTFSKNFFTSGALQTTNEGGTYAGDAFIAKLAGNPATNLIYLTYLGGNADDAAFCLAANPAGNAFVGGYTESTNFPHTNAIPGHAQLSDSLGKLTGNYLPDAFVAELNTNGSSLMYSTYLGGEASDAALSIALDSSNDAYVTGYTASTNFPVTPNALQGRLSCTNNIYYCLNAFVSEITNGGGALVYSTYLGGTNYDIGRGITVDTNNNVYVAGYTASYNFPVWNTPANLPYGRYLNGMTNRTSVRYAFDGFVTKLPPLNGTISPSSLTNGFDSYSTFLGGTNNDMAYGIAADGAGNAYVTGWTCSTNFPVTYNPPGLSSFVLTNGASFPPVATNVFLTKISSDGSQVLSSTIFGGRSVDIGYGVAVDPAGDAFVVGSESSTNFPTMNTSGSLSATNSSLTGGNDAFVAGFNANGSNMYYSVCLGGNRDTFGYGIALDTSTNVFITGQTDSTNYPTQNASRFWFNGTNVINGTNYINGQQRSGTNDAFVTEISLGALPAGPVITNFPVSVTNGVGATVSFSVGVSGTGPLIYQWYFNATNANSTNIVVNGGKTSSTTSVFSGATSNVLTIANIQATNTGYYTVIVTNDWGSTNATATLAVSESPFIVTPLTNQTVLIGSTVTFALTADGAPTLHYQWYYTNAVQTNGVWFYSNGIVLTNSGQFSGAKTNVLTLTDAQTTNAGTYEVIITNSFGSVTDSASLAVLVPEMSLSFVSNNITDGLEFSITNGLPNQKFYLWGTSNLVTGPIEWPAWTNIVNGPLGSQGQITFILTTPLTPSNAISESLPTLSLPILTNWQQGFFILLQTNN